MRSSVPPCRSSKHHHIIPANISYASTHKHKLFMLIPLTRHNSTTRGFNSNMLLVPRCSFFFFGGVSNLHDLILCVRVFVGWKTTAFKHTLYVWLWRITLKIERSKLHKTKRENKGIIIILTTLLSFFLSSIVCVREVCFSPKRSVSWVERPKRRS